MTLTQNIGKIDRAIRFGLGLLLMILTLLGIVGSLGWLGGILFATSLVRFCPIYKILGANMCEGCG